LASFEADAAGGTGGIDGRLRSRPWRRTQPQCGVNLHLNTARRQASQPGPRLAGCDAVADPESPLPDAGICSRCDTVFDAFVDHGRRLGNLAMHGKHPVPKKFVLARRDSGSNR